MADNYHQAYNELVQLEKSINAQLSELQKAVESGANIVKLENSIQANITAYASKRDMLERDHEKNHMKLPMKEGDKRTKTINNLKMNLDRMKMKFSGLTKKKYEDDCREIFGWCADCVSKVIQEEIEADEK